MVSIHCVLSTKLGTMENLYLPLRTYNIFGDSNANSSTFDLETHREKS